jgi:hypothetical protein
MMTAHGAIRPIPNEQNGAGQDGSRILVRNTPSASAACRNLVAAASRYTAPASVELDVTLLSTRTR